MNRKIWLCCRVLLSLCESLKYKGVESKLTFKHKSFEGQRKYGLAATWIETTTVFYNKAKNLEW